MRYRGCRPGRSMPSFDADSGYGKASVHFKLRCRDDTEHRASITAVSAVEVPLVSRQSVVSPLPNDCQCVIPVLNVILDVVDASGELQRLWRRQLTRVSRVARGLTRKRCVAAPTRAAERDLIAGRLSPRMGERS